jgi:hypothetical protein
MGQPMQFVQVQVLNCWHAACNYSVQVHGIEPVSNERGNQMNPSDLLHIYNQCSWALTAEIGATAVSVAGFIFGLVSE